MFFVQSRIGMNDVYVGLFIVAAYTVFAAVWTGWWRAGRRSGSAMPVIGLLLGLALASKWVAAYAIGALLLLILVRSALGRVLAILGLIGHHGRARLHGDQRARRAAGGGPGLRQPDVPADHGRADPAGGRRGGAPPDRLDRRGDALRDRRAGRRSAASCSSGRWRPAGSTSAITLGSLSVTPLLIAIALGARLAGRRRACSGWVARIGFGPLAAPPAADDPIRLLDPPGQPPDGWLRPGWLAGIPVVWMAACLVALPVVVYVITLHPVGADREPPARSRAGRPATPARRCST